MQRRVKMLQRDTFFGYHPAVNFLYFGLVLLFSMFFTHPICLLISFAAAQSYAIYLNGFKAVRLTLTVMLPLMLLTAVLNPIFNHEGVTILAYFPDGNPLTMESIACGAGSALMLASVILWFVCYSKVMSSDKFVYLFGRIIPALSLLLSMTLRFVPKFIAQIKIVRDAQKCMGRDIYKGKLFSRIQNGVTILSIMITWSLENAIETADSMKSRGYGLPGRTSFSIYRFDRRDLTALIFFCICGACVILGQAAGAAHWRYFPTMRGAGMDAFFVTFALCYFALCIAPLIINLKEDRKWKLLKSET